MGRRDAGGHRTEPASTDRDDLAGGQAFVGGNLVQQLGLALPVDDGAFEALAQLATDAEVARGLGLRVVDASMKAERGGGAPPTIEASEYKLFTTEFSKRLANASMDLGAPGTQLRVKTDDAPMKGRPESTYRYTVIDTIGGGSSEIQKNVIARRGLGLPKNF